MSRGVGATRYQLGIPQIRPATYGAIEPDRNTITNAASNGTSAAVGAEHTNRAVAADHPAVESHHNNQTERRKDDHGSDTCNGAVRRPPEVERYQHNEDEDDRAGERAIQHPEQYQGGRFRLARGSARQTRYRDEQSWKQAKRRSPTRVSGIVRHCCEASTAGRRPSWQLPGGWA